MMSKYEGIILVQAGGSVSSEATKACKKELSTHAGCSSPPRVLAPPLQKGLATLENFPALSNGVGISFSLDPTEMHHEEIVSDS